MAFDLPLQANRALLNLISGLGFCFDFVVLDGKFGHPWKDSTTDRTWLCKIWGLFFH